MPSAPTDWDQRADALHIALTQVVLEGGELSQIAAELAQVLDVGVLITSTDGRERAASVPAPVREALDGAGLLDPTGRFRVERAAKDGAVVGAGRARMMRVVAAGADLARLVCVRIDGPITDHDVRAMERACAVAALFITRQEAVNAVESKYRGDFLRDVFLGRAGDPAYVVEHGAGFGWDLGRPLLVACAEIDPPLPDEPPVSQARQRQFQERFSAAWRQVAAVVDPGIASLDFSSEVVTLLPAGADAAADTLLVERTVHAVRGDKGGGRRSFSVGVGRPVPGVTGLPAAYAQARRALEVGRMIHGRGSSTAFDQLGLHRLIALVPDPAELKAFAHDVLGVLAGTTQEAADLRETLQVLLDTNFNVAEAARTQFFHYNTMRYRVGKLERLLGPLGSDPHLRLDVAVALRVLEVTG
ncbi:PucR family transcriptional regulator [Nocardioides mangrovicus]|uniref:PucR family transcriptional regulator n=1 Tax=Nocardioides mangrovicus TaxID=2478913 RepID=A0A3L8P8N0_9ACTN|nr:helix-turn-helix domain-containing protein [Nocardioides mangrovicus]RLV50868.1 PucR family transcriptional regulator [Nocardioides mangrovicus]